MISVCSSNRPKRVFSTAGLTKVARLLAPTSRSTGSSTSSTDRWKSTPIRPALVRRRPIATGRITASTIPCRWCSPVRLWRTSSSVTCCHEAMTNAETAWVDGMTFAEVLAKTVERFGDHDALGFPWLGYRRSYREFQADVKEIARGLLALGVKRGEHIGIWTTNWPQWVITQFAAAQIGAVLVNINPAYRAHELQYVLNQADITTLLLTDATRNCSFFDILAEVCPELPSSSPGSLHCAACPRLRHVVSIKANPRPGMLDWAEFRRLAA